MYVLKLMLESKGDTQKQIFLLLVHYPNDGNGWKGASKVRR